MLIYFYVQKAPACTASQTPHKMVVLATAHPAKFSTAVSKGTGSQPEMPAGLAACQKAEVRFQVMPASTPAIKNYVEKSVPDHTGNRNVYTPMHFMAVSAVITLAFAAGVMIGRKSA